MSTHRPLAITCLALLCCARLAALDRHADNFHRLKKGPKFDIAAATFFGGPGVEEFTGVTTHPDGRIVAIGNSWGPPFPADVQPTVIGTDQLWNLPLYPGGEVLDDRGRVAPPANDHPNRTGFMVFYQPDLTAIDRVVRFGWGTANINTCLALRSGDGVIITGNATQRFAGLIDDGVPVRRVPRPEIEREKDRKHWGPVRYGDVVLPGDVYVAKLSPELDSIEWVWLLESHKDAPDRLFEGRDGQIFFLTHGRLKRIHDDGAAMSGFDGTDLGRFQWYFRGVHPESGKILAGHYWMRGTGREPWKRPFMYIFDAEGNAETGFFPWPGPLVGHDGFRLVSDSSVRDCGFLPNGDILIYGWSDGGNSVFHRHPTDLDRNIESPGLGMSMWGATVASFPNLVRFDPENPSDCAYTLFTAYLQTRPNSLTIDEIGGLSDGAIAFSGGCAHRLVQSTLAYYRDPHHYKHEASAGSKGPLLWHDNGWPYYQGMGGAGKFMVILSPDMRELWWSSIIANCVPTDFCQHEDDLAVVSLCTGGVLPHGRDPTFTSYDVADWPRLLAKLARKGPASEPSPEAQVWPRLTAYLREQIPSFADATEVPKDLQERINNAFDRILLEATGLYDPDAWPDAPAALDRYENRLLERLTGGGSLSADELAYLNRRLLELAWPRHIYPRPRHNLAVTRRPVQKYYGGGYSDGHIYLLERPAGLIDWRPKPLPKQKPRKRKEPEQLSPEEQRKRMQREKDAMARNLKVEETDLDAFAATWTVIGDGGSKGLRKEKLPGWCCTYAALRNPEKERPLFLFGWPDASDMQLEIGNQGGLSQDIEIECEGSFRLRLDGWAAWPAADWNDYACGAWVHRGREKLPAVEITVGTIRQWDQQNLLMQIFVNPHRGLLTDDQRKKFRPRYLAVADLTITAGEKKLTLEDVPLRIAFTDHATRWSMSIDCELEFNGSEIGLSGADAGPISLKLRHQAHGTLPKSHRTDKSDIPDIDLPDL